LSTFVFVEQISLSSAYFSERNSCRGRLSSWCHSGNGSYVVKAGKALWKVMRYQVYC